jgi:enolase-phosphatase E1
MTKGILLDIEGTTTPISFVYDVLFPFARTHAGAYLDEEARRSLKLEHDTDIAKGLTPPSWSFGALAYVHWLMDQDRKSTALKTLQGRVWREGYRRGELHGEVFPDVPVALERWNKAGTDVRIYSSGSVLAQQLLFSTTTYGDLTRFLKGYFDTTTGPKTEASSYARIAEAFQLQPSEIVFLSDVKRELDAASAAGLGAQLAVRPGNASQPASIYPRITDFLELRLSGSQ